MVEQRRKKSEAMVAELLRKEAEVNMRGREEERSETDVASMYTAPPRPEMEEAEEDEW